MKTRDEIRTWAARDRSIARPLQYYNARSMRATPTEAEQKLWWHLRHRLKIPATHFRRQVRIGRFIADFASHKAKLVIEVDGSQHLQKAPRDAERIKYLESRGYRILRYWNNDMLANTESVLEDIQRTITTTPTPDPSPQGGGV